MLYRLIGPTAGDKAHFLEALFSPYYDATFRIVGFVAIGGLILGIFLTYLFPAKNKGSLFVFSSVATGLLFFFNYFLYTTTGAVQRLFFEIWVTRTTTIPLCVLLALTMGILQFWPIKAWEKRRGPLHLGISLLSISALIVSLEQDLAMTEMWKEGYAHLQKMEKENPGCNVISADAAIMVFERSYGIAKHWLSCLSLSLDDGNHPSSIFFVEKEITGNSCSLEKSEIYQQENCITLQHIDLWPNFGELKRGPIRIFEWDSTNNKLTRHEIEPR